MIRHIQCSPANADVSLAFVGHLHDFGGHDRPRRKIQTRAADVGKFTQKQLDRPLFGPDGVERHERPNGHRRQSPQGDTLFGQGQQDRALECFRQAVELDPDDGSARVSLGDLLYEQGDLDGARGCYEQALAADPDLVQAYLSLGNLLLDLEEPEQALRAYEAFMARETSPGAKVCRSSQSSRGIATGSLKKLSSSGFMGQKHQLS